MSWPSPFKSHHHSSYPAIDPNRPELSAKGKNVLVTGAGSGIGQEIALSFARASVSNIALVGRRTQPLDETKDLIKAAAPQTNVYTYSADVSNLEALQKAFSGFATAANGPIHVVAANAGMHPGVGTVQDFSSKSLSDSLIANVVGVANTIQAYKEHLPAEKDSDGYRGKIIHTSSGVTHVNIPQSSAYSVAKTAGAKLLEFHALENPDVFVLNFHPGIIETPMSSSGSGLKAEDEISLPADFTVWAASAESAFLGSGRLIWAHWDVDELKELFAKYKTGEFQDGMKAVGGKLPVHQSFTLGLLKWDGYEHSGQAAPSEVNVKA